MHARHVDLVGYSGAKYMAQIITQPDKSKAPLEEKSSVPEGTSAAFTYTDPADRGQIYDPESTWYLVHGRLKSSQL